MQDSGDLDFSAKLDAWDIELQNKVKEALRQNRDAIQVIRDSIRQLEHEEFQDWPLPVSYENHGGYKLPQVQSFDLMLRYREKVVSAKMRGIPARHPTIAKLKREMNNQKEISPKKDPIMGVIREREGVRSEGVSLIKPW